jgi:hypothetical protein
MRVRLGGISPLIRIVVLLVVFAGAGISSASVLAARGDVGGRLCTRIGSWSGVGVDLGLDRLHNALDAVRLHRSFYRSRRAEQRRRLERVIRAHGIRHVVLCANARCREAALVEFLSNGALLDDTAHGPDLVRVTVVVERRDQPLQEAASTVRLERFEPNGPGCGTWWTAGMRLRGERLIVIQNGDRGRPGSPVR